MSVEVNRRKMLSANHSSVTWSAITDDQATLAVGSIAIQPQLTSPDASKSVILVGTGETNSSSDSYYGLSILRSAQEAPALVVFHTCET